MRPEYDQTIDMIESMTDEELQAVRDAAIMMMHKKPIERSFLHLSEKDYFARIDEGLAELDAGLGEDSDMVNSEIANEFELNDKE